jgi:hypothetical protein
LQAPNKIIQIGTFGCVGIFHAPFANIVAYAFTHAYWKAALFTFFGYVLLTLVLLLQCSRLPVFLCSHAV